MVECFFGQPRFHFVFAFVLFHIRCVCLVVCVKRSNATDRHWTYSSAITRIYFTLFQIPQLPNANASPRELSFEGSFSLGLGLFVWIQNNSSISQSFRCVYIRIVLYYRFTVYCHTVWYFPVDFARVSWHRFDVDTFCAPQWMEIALSVRVWRYMAHKLCGPKTTCFEYTYIVYTIFVRSIFFFSTLFFWSLHRNEWALILRSRVH